MIHNQPFRTPYFKFYAAAINSAQVMRTVDPGRTVRGSGRGSTCCLIVVGSPGNIVLRPVGGASDGTGDVTYVVPAGTVAPTPIPLEVDQITSSTATNIAVYWPRNGEET